MGNLKEQGETLRGDDLKPYYIAFAEKRCTPPSPHQGHGPWQPKSGERHPNFGSFSSSGSAMKISHFVDGSSQLASDTDICQTMSICKLRSSPNPIMCSLMFKVSSPTNSSPVLRAPPGVLYQDPRSFMASTSFVAKPSQRSSVL